MNDWPPLRREFGWRVAIRDLADSTTGITLWHLQNLIPPWRRRRQVREAALAQRMGCSPEGLPYEVLARLERGHDDTT